MRDFWFPFIELSAPFTPSWVEGPTVLKISDQYIAYYDMYRDKKYGAMRSKNLKQWEDISTQLSLPQGTRHGTAFRVSREVLTTLMNAPSGQNIAPPNHDERAGKVAAKPLFRDPIYDGAADPVFTVRTMRSLGRYSRAIWSTLLERARTTR